MMDLMLPIVILFDVQNNMSVPLLWYSGSSTGKAQVARSSLRATSQRNALQGALTSAN